MICIAKKWRDLLSSWAVAPSLAGQTFEDIRANYAGPGRFYHTLDHVENMLKIVENLGSYVPNLNAVKLATWLHDVIYDSRASDNEERSATYAGQVCKKCSIPEGDLVAALIRTTKTHDPGDKANAKVLIDADLAILGASESVYSDYCTKIRQEYAWVPEVDYRHGRRLVLQSFLNRPTIYHFLPNLDAPARRNLAAEIAHLLDY